MDDILDSIPISEDDVVININFLLLFTARDGFAGFDTWMQEHILNSFKGYDYKNAIRLNKTEFLSDKTIAFWIKLINPDIAPQEIFDDIDNRLHGILKTFSIKNAANLWKDISIFMVGDEEKAKDEASKYIEKLRKRP